MTRPPASPVSRRLVGVLALVLFALAAGVAVFEYPADEGQRMLALGAFVRVGLLMAALWLALPSKDRPAAWANLSWTTFLALILIVVFLGRLKLMAIPVVVAVVLAWWLYSRFGRPRR